MEAPWIPMTPPKAPVQKDPVPGFVSGLSAQEASVEVGKFRRVETNRVFLKGQNDENEMTI